MAMIMVLAMAVPAMAAEGNGTITITNASIGQTYTAYKVFDATYNGTTGTTAYSVKAGALKDAAKESGYFVIAENPDADGNYNVSVAEDAKDSAILDWLKANVELFEEVDSEKLESGNKVEFNVPYGYYYITSTLGTAVTVNTNTPSVEVIDKNTTSPSIPEEDGGKKIVTSDGEKVEQNTASIGSVVNFEIAFSATNFDTNEDGDTTQITKYTITDSPTGMEIDENSIEVRVGSAVVDDASVNIENGTMTIELSWVDAEGNSIYASPVDVVVTYSAKITAAAASGTATNKAVIKYNDTELPEETTTTKTYAITVNKVNENGAQLEGAKFELYDQAENKINLVFDETEGFYRVATPDEIAEEGFESAVVEAGEATIKGLSGQTTYYLEEIKAPDGYNMLTERQAVVTETEDSEGNKIAGDATISVVNKSGTVLPSTGGMGTKLFYLVGGILVVAAGVILVSRKRMEQ